MKIDFKTVGLAAVVSAMLAIGTAQPVFAQASGAREMGTNTVPNAGNPNNPPTSNTNERYYNGTSSMPNSMPVTPSSGTAAGGTTSDGHGTCGTMADAAARQACINNATNGKNR